MNLVQRIIKNTGILLFSELILKITLFLYTMFIARYLSVKGFGTLSFAIAFSHIISIFYDLGLSTFTTREIASNKSLVGKFLGNIALMKLIMVSISSGLMIIIVNLVGYQEIVKNVIYLMTLSAIINCFINLFNSIFSAFEKMEFISIGRILNAIFMVVGINIVFFFEMDIIAISSLYFIVNAIILGYSFAICIGKFELHKLKVDIKFWKRTIKESFPIGISSIFITIYFNLNPIMLSFFINYTVVGWYDASMKIIFMFTILPTVFIQAIFPIISRHFKYSRDIVGREYALAFKYIFIIAIFFFINGLIFADNLILMFFGEKYIPSIISLQILICVIPFIFLTILFGNFLIAIGKQKVVSVVAGLNVSVSIISSLILIPTHSYIGASIVYVITEVCGWILMFSYISKNYFKISIKKNLITPVFSGVFTILFIFLLKQQINWILTGIFGVIFYILMLFILKIVSRDDILLLRQLILN